MQTQQQKALYERYTRKLNFNQQINPQNENQSNLANSNHSLYKKLQQTPNLNDIDENQKPENPNNIARANAQIINSYVSQEKNTYLKQHNIAYLHNFQQKFLTSKSTIEVDEEKTDKNNRLENKNKNQQIRKPSTPTYHAKSSLNFLKIKKQQLITHQQMGLTLNNLQELKRSRSKSKNRTSQKTLFNQNNRIQNHQSNNSNLLNHLSNIQPLKRHFKSKSLSKLQKLQAAIEQFHIKRNQNKNSLKGSQLSRQSILSRNQQNSRAKSYNNSVRSSSSLSRDSIKSYNNDLSRSRAQILKEITQKLTSSRVLESNLRSLQNQSKSSFQGLKKQLDDKNIVNSEEGNQFHRFGIPKIDKQKQSIQFPVFKQQQKIKKNSSTKKSNLTQRLHNLEDLLQKIEKKKIQMALSISPQQLVKLKDLEIIEKLKKQINNLKIQLSGFKNTLKSNHFQNHLFQNSKTQRFDENLNSKYKFQQVSLSMNNNYKAKQNKLIQTQQINSKYELNNRFQYNNGVSYLNNYRPIIHNPNQINIAKKSPLKVKFAYKNPMEQNKYNYANNNLNYVPFQNVNYSIAEYQNFRNRQHNNKFSDHVSSTKLYSNNFPLDNLYNNRFQNRQNSNYNQFQNPRHMLQFQYKEQQLNPNYDSSNSKRYYQQYKSGPSHLNIDKSYHQYKNNYSNDSKRFSPLKNNQIYRKY